MKGIMITAPGSGSGKTTLTLGIIRALYNRGYNICGFKTGPDYIDTAFIKAAAKKAAGNLDIHLQGSEGVKAALSLGEGDFAIIEGAMGYFDGIYNTFENSSYDIARLIDIPAILVYTPKGEMFSAIPKIKGLAEFEGSTIKGVILNKVNKVMYEMLKEQLDKYTGLSVLGYLEDSVDIKTESRHLGLVQSLEINDIDEKIEKIAQAVEKNIDLELLLNLMKDIKTEKIIYPPKFDVRVAIAYDKAFSFYYRENILLFEKCCKVNYFSPLKDSRLPDCDLVYLGGGYPEVFKEELSANKAMLASVKEFAEGGGYIYGECGGLMYLMENIEEKNMTGIFKGKSELTNTLQRFGYIEMELKRDCFIGKKGDRLTAHEFHKSITTINAETIFSIKKARGNRKWECGYLYKNVLAGYPHVNFLGNLNSFTSMLENISMKVGGINVYK